MNRFRRIVEHRKARDDGEAGFTLIELMVVLLIMGILMAIAIPTFLGVRGTAQNKAAQSTLRNALTSAQASYVGGVQYPTTLGSKSSSGFNWTTGASSDSNTVSVAVGPSSSPQSVVLGTFSKSGNCYYIVNVMSSTSGITKSDLSSTATTNVGTWYGEDGTNTGGTSQTSCTAADQGTPVLPTISSNGGAWSQSTSKGW